MDPSVLWVPALIAAIAAGAYLMWKREQDRRARWAAMATERGWTYSHQRDRTVAQWFHFLDQLRKGRNRYAVDVVRGRLADRPMLAFTHHYEVTKSSGDSQRTKHYWHAVVAVQVTDRQSFPELTIGPENMLSRFGNLFTNRDIDFESIEFSRGYKVHCSDRRFAYDVCNPAMIEFLLDQQGTVLELEGQWLATIEDGKLRLGSVDRRLHHLAGVADRLPAFLFRS